MAADWHPADKFEPIVTRLFIGTSYASGARYPMDDCDVIDIGLHVIKRCEMYSEEYKNWIARENETPPIIEMIDSFKEYCTLAKCAGWWSGHNLARIVRTAVSTRAAMKT